MRKTFVSSLRDWLSAWMDTLCPPRCLACHTLLPVETHPPVCEPCSISLLPILTPRCDRCGLPFPQDSAHKTCGACAITSPRFDRATASFVHGAAIRDAIHRLKYGLSPGIGAPALHALCESHGTSPPIPEAGDIIVPVPLHPKKLRKRGFNQAALLARVMASKSQRARLVHALTRVRDTADQHTLSPNARQTNVKGAFAVVKKKAIAGASVLLVDDVFTTGATAEACAVALRRGGARRVTVWSVSRVVPSLEPEKE